MRTLGAFSLVRRAVIVAISVLPAGAARAEMATFYAPVGLLGSVSSRAAGIGAELTLNYLDFDGLGLGFGLLGQYEWLSNGGNRYAGGGQIMFAPLPVGWGVELAVARFEQSTASSTDFCVAPFLSFLGFVSAALRLSAPLASTGPAPPPFEVGLAITLKLPLPLNGGIPWGTGG